MRTITITATMMINDVSDIGASPNTNRTTTTTNMIKRMAIIALPNEEVTTF